MPVDAFPVAVVGIATELPSGTYAATNLNHQEFFRFLLDKGESYEPVPGARFNADALQGNALGQVLAKNGSFLKRLDLFDHVEFGVSAKDAQYLAVAARKLVELTFLALLDSGIDYRGRNVGCFMAGVSHDIYMLGGQDEYEARGSVANGPAMLANRVSYCLDLRGPSIPIDTACSSSMTAVHLAMQSLHTGECEAVVVGGCQLNLRVVDWANYSLGGILSSDGKCKPFDASANGFARAEGGVSIVLKPLEAALKDGDHIYGTILGTAINSTGSLAPVSAPVASAQQAAMEAALRQARLSPQDVDFFELHATGTSRGDPTEANWIGALFQRDSEILVGSTKGNVGHLEITAFLASLSKVLSIFESGLIPPTANLVTPNPAIKWAEYRMRAPTEVTPLPVRKGRAVVGMTSSGIGGSNGSCLVQSPPEPRVRCSRGTFWATCAHDRPRLFTCGGLSPRTASALAEMLLQQREEGVDHDALALTYGRRARSMPWTSYALGSRGDSLRFSEPVLSPKARGPLVFVFSGQGPQHIAMGRELFRSSIVFRKSILQLDAIYERTTGHSLIRKYGLFDPLVEPESALGDIWPIAVTLPALTIIQLALVDTIRFLGLKPDMVIGHSAGETAVLYASGVASKEMTVQLSIARGLGMTPLEDLGCSMAAVSCAPEEAEEIIAQVIGELGLGSLEIGCYNSTDALTLSGANSHLNRAVEIAIAKGMFARKVKTRVAVHSSMMEHCRETYCDAVGKVFGSHVLADPTAVIFSSATGDRLETIGADYFWTNSRGPVRFQQAIQTLNKTHPNATFLEIGPHPVLTSYLSSLVEDSVVACPLRRLNLKKPEKDVELRAFLGALGQLATARHHVDYSLLGASDAHILRKTPAYPFQPKSIPLMLPSSETKRFTQPRNGPLNFPELRVNSQTHPSLADHLIKSTPIMPATGYVEMALEFGARRLWNVQFVNMLGLSSSRPIPVQVKLDSGRWTVRSSSSLVDANDGDAQFDRLHAEGFLSVQIGDEDRCPADVNLMEVRARCQPFEVARLYDEIKHFADYGPDYRRITAIAFNGDEALVEVRTSTTSSDPVYIFHPAVLDASLHAVIHPAMTGNRDGQLYYLPACARSVTIHDALLEGMPDTIVSHLVRRHWTPRLVEFDCTISTKSGVRLCTLEGLGIQQHGASVTGLPSERYDLTYIPASLPSLASCRTPSIEEEWCFPDIPTPEPPASTHIIAWKRGEEMLIQDQLAMLETHARETFWFIGSSDDQGAVGFARSFRREFIAWTVKLVLFHASWSEVQRKVAIKALMSMDYDLEDELVVDAKGNILVPRLQALSTPSSNVVFDPSRPWTVEGKGIAHVDHSGMLSVDDSRITIELLAVSQGTAGLREFTGREPGSKCTVMGVTDSPISNFALVPRDVCIEIPSGEPDTGSVPPLLAIAIASHALGPGAFDDYDRLRSRLRHSSIIITHKDSPVGRALWEIFTLLGITFMSLPSSHDLSRLAAGSASIILSGYEDLESQQALEAALEADGTIFGWASGKTDLLRSFRKRPWMIGDASRASLNTGLLAKLTKVATTAPLHLVQNAPSAEQRVPSRATLFDAQKAYILVGGCGSLGADVAFWMYENGARHLILTSRSGRANLAKRGDPKPLRMLAYLESLPDLDLRLPAVDAASAKEMSAMLKGVQQPIGGCMLMAVALIDGLFSRQEASSFDAVFAPKVGAMAALQRSLDVATLDWLITFSSVSAFFGNAGQTSYASANTALDGMLRDLPNAFSLVVPAMLDSSVAIQRNAAQLRHLTDFGLTSRQLCACIEDGLRILAERPFSHYVPDFDWNVVNARMGASPIYQHLVTDNASSDPDEEAGRTVEDVVLQHLDVARSDLSLEVPLTAYGLDSLSAERLAHALRVFAPLTQMQLLGDMSINDIYRSAQAEAAKAAMKS